MPVVYPPQPKLLAQLAEIAPVAADTLEENGRLSYRQFIKPIEGKRASYGTWKALAALSIHATNEDMQPVVARSTPRLEPFMFLPNGYPLDQRADYKKRRIIESSVVSFLPLIKYLEIPQQINIMGFGLQSFNSVVEVVNHRLSAKHS